MIAQVLSYSFNPSLQQITIKDVQVVDPTRVQYIINQTRGVALYNYSDPAYTLTTDGTNIVTVSYNTSGMAYNDVLQITYDFFLDSGETGGLTDVELRASPVPVTGTLSVSLPSGASTAAKQDTGNTSLASIDSKLTNPLPVSIPVGISTAANQATEIASLSSIDGKLNTLGQKTKAGSVPVVLASDSDPLVVSIGATDNTTLYNTNLTTTGAITGILTTGYQSLALQITGTWVGIVMIEGSNDNSNWTDLMFISVDDIAAQQTITDNGLYALKVSTKYVRLNVIQLQSGTIVPVLIGRTIPGIAGADLLSLAMDKSNNTPLYTEDIAGPLKRDKFGALVLTDNVQYTFTGPVVSGTVQLMLDVTGYNSFTVTTPTLGASTNVQHSGDGVNWSLLYGMNPSASTSPITTLGNQTTMSFPVIGKFIRFLAQASGNNTFTVTLKLAPFTPFGGVGQPVNIGYLAGANTSSSNPITLATGIASATTGYFPVSGPIAVGSTLVQAPVVVGGRDSAVTGALAGRVRTLLLDSDGRLDLTGTLSAAQTSQNSKTLAVQDLAQFEGQNITELLAQLLLEMKIANQYMYELPRLLQTGGGYGNEPVEFRNEQSIFNL